MQSQFDKRTIHSNNLYQIHSYVMNYDTNHTGKVDGKMCIRDRSATLLRLNKQEQVKALHAVGFADITENSRSSEFPNRIKWSAGLLDMRVACNRISDNSKWYFTREEWLSYRDSR